MADELKASAKRKAPQPISDESHVWKAAAYDAQQQTGVKCRVLSISQRYITLETDQLHNLQQGQAVTIHAD